MCPEHIKITDNALIPMKEHVVGRKYDPLVWLGDKIGRRTPKDTPDSGQGLTSGSPRILYQTSSSPDHVQKDVISDSFWHMIMADPGKRLSPDEGGMKRGGRTGHRLR